MIDKIEKWDHISEACVRGASEGDPNPFIERVPMDPTLFAADDAAGRAQAAPMHRVDSFIWACDILEYTLANSFSSL